MNQFDIVRFEIAQREMKRLERSRFEKIARTFWRKSLLQRLYLPAVILMWLIIAVACVYLEFFPGSWLDKRSGMTVVLLISVLPFGLWGAASWYVWRLTHDYDLYEYYFAEKNRTVQALVRRFPSGSPRVELVKWGGVYRAPTHREQLQSCEEARYVRRMLIDGREYNVEFIADFELLHCDMTVDETLSSGILWGEACLNRQRSWKRSLETLVGRQWRDSSFSRDQIQSGFNSVAEKLSTQSLREFLKDCIRLKSLTAIFTSLDKTDEWRCVSHVK